jgi:hypothetical protein
MNDDARFLLCASVFVAWLACIGFAGDVGARKNCRFSGIILGLFFGPLGIIAAGFLDARPQCPNCGGRLNGTKEVPLFPVCQHCRCELRPAKEAVEARTDDDLIERCADEPIPAYANQSNAQFHNLHDTTWNDELKAAEQRLILAGCLPREHDR